jgi:hypothetical protein
MALPAALCGEATRGSFMPSNRFLLSFTVTLHQAMVRSSDWQWKHVRKKSSPRVSSTSNSEHELGNRKMGKKNDIELPSRHNDSRSSSRAILACFSSRFNCIAYYVSIACLLCVDTTVCIPITQRLITKLMSNIFGKVLGVCFALSSLSSYLITNRST